MSTTTRDFRELSEPHRRLIQAVFDRFVVAAEWPLVAELQHALDHGGEDLDVESVGAGLDRVLGVVDSTRYQGRAQLSIHGVSLCVGGASVLDDLRRTATLEYERWLADGVTAQLTSADLATVCGFSDLQLRRTRVLMDQLPGWLSISGGPDTPWTVALGLGIRRLKGVETVEQLLAVVPLPGYPDSTWPLSATRATATQPAPRQAVFISVAESHKRSLAYPLRDLLEANGLEALIVSDLPRPGAAWTAEEKVTRYLEASQAVIALATADLVDDQGRAHPRSNITDEIGRARGMPNLRDRICILKDRTSNLPSNIAPVYELLDVDAQNRAFAAALDQLREWGFGIPRPPRDSSSATVSPELTDGILLLDGLAVDDPSKTRRRVLSWLQARSLAEQAGLAALMVSVTLGAPEWEKRSIAAHAVESMAALDPGLVPAGLIDELSRHPDSSVRSSMAVILHDRALRAPGLVPLPVVARLADSSGDQAPVASWYVYTPARACLSQLALTRPEAWDVVRWMASSPVPEMREGAADIVARVAAENPAVVPPEVLAEFEAGAESAVGSRLIAARISVAEVSEDERRAAYGPFSAF
jgi:Predicted nucleotide-binding protein containing TIR-like domain